MLELIRKYRSLFTVIFVLSATGLVVSMFGGNSRSKSSGGLTNSVAAKVEGEEISAMTLVSAISRQLEEVDRRIEDEVQKSDKKAETRRMLQQYLKAQWTPDRVLSELIRERFMINTAKVVGIAAPANKIMHDIQTNTVFQKDGRYDPLLYKQYVPNPGNYEGQLQQRAQVEGLQSSFEIGLGIVSSLEKEQSEKITKKQKYETLSLSSKSFKEPKSVNPAEVAEFIAKPESKAKLQASYDKNIKKYKSSEQIQARHILIKDGEVGNGGGEAKAKEVLAEISSGKITFVDAAKIYSQDKSNSEKGGDLGFFGRGVMDSAFENAAFALTKAGELSKAPVKSSFGFHLIEFVARKPGEEKSLDQVKTEIGQEVLLEEKRAEAVHAWAEKWTASAKAPTEADLKSLNLKWMATEWSPLDEFLGPVNANSHMTELVAMGPGSQLIKSPINQGDNVVLVRWVGPSAKLVAAEKTGSELQNQKVGEALQFFLKNRMDELEKKKKIVRSEALLSQLKTQMDRQGAGGT